MGSDGNITDNALVPQDFKYQSFDFIFMFYLFSTQRHQAPSQILN